MLTQLARQVLQGMGEQKFENFPVDAASQSLAQCIQDFCVGKMPISEECTELIFQNIAVPNYQSESYSFIEQSKKLHEYIKNMVFGDQLQSLCEVCIIL